MATIDAGLDRGRMAATPSRMPLEGWKDILWRTQAEFFADRITLIAAGATFYLLLALFPALAAFVSVYGFVADPVTIADHIAFLGSVLPSGGVEIIRAQLQALASQDNAALSFAFIFGLLFALWSANSGIKTLFEALNVAYAEVEKRSFVRLNLVSFLFTLGAIVIGILFIVCVGVIPAVLAFTGLGGWEETLVSVLRWPTLIIVSAGAISVLYRYGPSREHAKWRWVTWGALFATVAWLISSILFSWYLTNFADYNATYGSLGAVIGFMLWTWLSVVILLLGAELNAELEHQTARDSTTGPELPMGARGATMADTLGSARSSRVAKAEAEEELREPLHFPDQKEDSINVKPKQPPSRLGDVLAFGMPIVVLGMGLALELLGRRREATRKLPPPPPPSTLRDVASLQTLRTLLDRGRELMDSTQLKAVLATAGRQAMHFGEAAARKTRSPKRRAPNWKSWFRS